MPSTNFDQQVFEQIDFTTAPFVPGIYEDCTFKHCNLSGVDLSHTKFYSCSFDTCNLSLCKVNHTVFNEITFKHTKLLGLRFDSCNEFGLVLNFENCIIDHASFHACKIPKTLFKQCQLHGTDFTETDLSGVQFERCDLLDAVFSHSKLEKADFRTAFNYQINPTINNLKKAKFALSGISGLLTYLDITIDLTH